MSRGQYTCTVTHDCGQDITVRVTWWDYPAYRPRNGDPGDPPDAGCEWEHDEVCPTCHKNLPDDAVFQKQIEDETSRSEYYDEGPDPFDSMDYPEPIEEHFPTFPEQTESEPDA